MAARGSALADSYHSFQDRTLPVLAADPADGKLLRRFDFPAAGPKVRVAPHPGGFDVATGGAAWSVGAR